MKLNINKKTSALLVIDCQVSFINALSETCGKNLLNNLRKVIEFARTNEILIIYVVAQFREGYPEVSFKNDLISKAKKDGALQECDSDTRICEEIQPKRGEVIVPKRRISAFSGTDLEIILRSNNIDTIILTGYSSVGAVESTARSAFDMDYSLIAIKDCCADLDIDINEITLTKLLPCICTVCSSSDFLNCNIS